MRGVRWDLLAWLLGRERVEPVSRRTWRGWCSRMEELGYLTRESLLGQQWVSLTLHGARMTGTSWNRYRLPLHKLAHVQAVGEVRFYLEGLTPEVESRWVPEDAFRQGQAGKLAPYRRPDGGWELPDGGLAAVEVELHRKTAFAGEYLELVRRMPPEADVVWWFVPTRQDAEWLAGKLEAAPIPCRVRPLPFLSRPEVHEERCWCLVCRHAGKPGLRELAGRLPA